MLINVKDKINYKNFITVLKLFDEANSIDVTGKDKGEINNVNIKNITMEQYCNIFQASHFTPNKKFELTNINMDGRFNIIELTDLPKGRFVFKVKNSFEEDVNSEVGCNQVSLDKIDKILKTIERQEKTYLIKNKSHDKFDINHLDLNKYRVHFLKNISGDTMVPLININYNHDNLKLILDNTVGTIVINNISEPRIKHSKIIKNTVQKKVKKVKEINDEIDDEVINMVQDKIDDIDQIDEINQVKTTKPRVLSDEVEEIEGFANVQTCTTGGQIIMIALVILFVYNLVTKRQTIKLFY